MELIKRFFPQNLSFSSETVGTVFLFCFFFSCLLSSRRTRTIISQSQSVVIRCNVLSNSSHAETKAEVLENVNMSHVQTIYLYLPNKWAVNPLPSSSLSSSWRCENKPSSAPTLDFNACFLCVCCHNSHFPHVTFTPALVRHEQHMLFLRCGVVM